MSVSRATAALTLAAALFAPHVSGQQSSYEVPLYDDLGTYHRDISTASPDAQRYFDQGLRLYYAFNHAEAVRAFRQAQRIDPTCAMCWWGESMAFGPNINLPMDSASGVAAYEALQGAMERRPYADDRERALIDALETRFERVPRTDRSALDLRYAEAMATLADRYPADVDIQTLRAEALMDLRPWDYWTEAGEPKEGIAQALASLEGVLDRDADHPGACHFFIHAVEKVYPERAVHCAERLAALMPGAGHLVHMPGHIYIRIGRYLDAIEANRHAVHADETYIQDQQPGMGMYTAGYYPHNYDFMAFATMMIGRSEESIGSAEKVTALLPEELFEAPGMDFLQHWTVRPLQMRVRFARWDEILATPKPRESFPHATAVWHYARGRAFAARGDVEAARSELASLRAIAMSSDLDGLRMEFNASEQLLGIAERVLTGWTKVAARDLDGAVAALREAVQREDALLYGEPPEWSVPTRQDLGAVLLLTDQATEAEQTFREDLEAFPENGWSLHGLSVALRRQGRTPEAEAVERRLMRVWSTADVDLSTIVPR